MTRPNLPPQPPLSREQADQADQMARFVERTRQTIEMAGEAIDLRKWCVEKAIEAAKGGHTAWPERDEHPGRPVHIQFAVVAIARDIHAFISEPLKIALDGLERAAKEKDR
jgi:hypothetical protein